MLFGSRPESCLSARKLKEVFGVPVSCVTVKGYLHLVLWNTSELFVLCVTLVFYAVIALRQRPGRLGWLSNQFPLCGFGVDKPQAECAHGTHVDQRFWNAGAVLCHRLAFASR